MGEDALMMRYSMKIPLTTMKIIAKKFLGLNDSQIKISQERWKDDDIMNNFSLLGTWRNQYVGPGAMERLNECLTMAARRGLVEERVINESTNGIEHVITQSGKKHAKALSTSSENDKAQSTLMRLAMNVPLQDIPESTVMRLAMNIPLKDMLKIAKKYLGVEESIIRRFMQLCRGNEDLVNYCLLQSWQSENSMAGARTELHQILIDASQNGILPSQNFDFM